MKTDLLCAFHYLRLRPREPILQRDEVCCCGRGLSICRDCRVSAVRVIEGERIETWITWVYRDGLYIYIYIHMLCAHA